VPATAIEVKLAGAEGYPKSVMPLPSQIVQCEEIMISELARM
jgi:hypothetical protein